MRKRTYRILIILAVVVVALSVALAIGLHYRQEPSSDSTASNTTQQPSDNMPSWEQHDSTPSENQWQQPEGSTFEIHFFDVGEGDSALVECDGHYMLIDGGNPGSSSFLYSYLKKHEIDYLDYIVCSHAHTDHVGGLAGALNYATVGVAYAPVTEYDSRAFNGFLKYLSAQSKEIVIPSPGDIITLGNATVTFMGPIDMTLAEQNMNNSSIILRVEYGYTSFLFTGDAEIEEELSLITSGFELQSTLIKVGHHGSYTSSSDAFLSSVDPDYAVISVGEGNEYGHPHDVTLNRLSNVCDSIYRTDIDGEITCISDGNTLSFVVSRK